MKRTDTDLDSLFKFVKVCFDDTQWSDLDFKFINNFKMLFNSH